MFSPDLTCSAEDVIKSLAVRTRIEDPRYFFGRTLACRKLAMSKVAWIFGPARVGKSSLARQLCRQSPPGVLCLWVDASDLSSGGFDELLERVIAEASPSIDITPGDARARFTALAQSSSRRPVRIVFDELDRIALHLTMDQQLLLRKLAHIHDGFSYIVTTRLDPARLVEEFSEPASRLLGIATQQRLGQLERRDVRKVFARVAEDLGRPEFAKWEQLVFTAVGGHPVAVIALAHALACREVDNVLDEASACSVLDREKNEISQHLASLWRDLGMDTRSFLLDLDSLSPAGAASPRLDGFLTDLGPVRPKWLVDVGSRMGAVATIRAPIGGNHSAWARADRLDELVYSINVAVKRLEGHEMFETTNEVNARYLLVREGGTAEEFAATVGHLHKRLYEAARIPELPLPGAKPCTKWRIPGAITDTWRNSQGLRWLGILRNSFDHDQNRNYRPDQVNKDFVAVGETFASLCGSKSPTSTSQFISARDRLVEQLLSDLEAVHAAATAVSRPSSR